VVYAVHRQEDRPAGALGLLARERNQVADGSLPMVGDDARAGVACIGWQVAEQHAAAVGRLPPQLLLQPALVQPAEVHGRADAEAAQNLRQLRDVAEGVGDVARLLHPAEALRDAVAEQQVAHQRLAADEEFVGQHVPRAHAQPALADELCQRLPRVRPDLQVVVEHDGLAVEVEVGEARVTLQQREQPVHEANEPHPEVLERLIPLPVPVGVRDDVHGRFRLCQDTLHSDISS